MTQISISDISKNPSILDKLDDVTKILNKKTKQVKGVFIPNDLLYNFKHIFLELEYKQFLKRNKNIKSDVSNDETLLDGLKDAY